VRLAEWLAQNQIEPSVTYSVTEFYNDLPDQSQNRWDTAHGDLKWLEARGLISLHATLGGIEGLSVVIKACLPRLRGRRPGTAREQGSAQGGLLRCDGAPAVRARGSGTWTGHAGPRCHMADTWHGPWYAGPFSEADLDDAADWLHRNGLVGGVTVDQALGPVRLYLTDEGVRCAEDFDSDTNAYMADQRRPAGMQRSPERDSPEIGQ
jgi:hypothetical protein